MWKNLIFRSAPSALAILSLAAMATAIWPNSSAANQAQLAPTKHARLNFVLPPLLNFNAFKTKFGKQYKSLAEEMGRKLYFLPRAMRAVVSAVRYKFGYDASYKRLNAMSDYSPAELDQVMPDVASLIEDTPSEILADAAQIRAAFGGPLHSTLANTSAPVSEQPLIEQLGAQSGQQRRSRRRKRQTSGSTLVWHMRSMSEMGVTDMIPNARFARDSRLSADELARLPDEVFVDHRQSGCLSEPRIQGRCGSYYAFSIVSIMEHMICKQKNSMTLLSEQYIVDCGKGRYNDRIRGCNGGTVKAAASFVHDFGLETAARYAYAAGEQQCPFELDASANKKAGYIRMELAKAVHIHQDYWETVLEAGGPLMVHACTYPGMVDYGGGVDLQPNCRPRPSHEMVLVGHGREEGRHYRLVRNSFGPSWGEQGYWRVSKSTARRCMGKYGEAFGSSDGINFDAKARLTEPRKPPIDFGQPSQS